MDYQHPHGYVRHPPPPPPPSAADPFERPPNPPIPPNHPWPYAPTQFHYQTQTQHSPSPPPSQWHPPPHSSEHAQYPPYPAHHPPPHPHYPPPVPPRPPHLPQAYSQDWGSGSWNHHQSWQYPTPANNNEEDWAARAKAWAAAKSASDGQQTSSQFVPAGRPEEQNHLHDHPQSMDPQRVDRHTPLAPASNYPQFPAAMGASNRISGTQLQDFQYMSSGKSSYAAGNHAPLAARDGGIAGNSVPPFPPQEKSPITPLIHQQEVPSSYPSVAGNLEAGNRYEKLYSSSSTPVVSHQPHHIQHMPPTTSRSGWVEEPHHVHDSHPAESVTDISDQPLHFAAHFNRDPGPHVQPNYGHSSNVSVRGGDPSAAASSNYAWPPSNVHGAAYPPAPPMIPLGPQVDHPIAIPSPVSGHTASIFPPGPGFQHTVPMVGAAFGVGAGVTPHPTTFSGDAYGAAERPKKASVPNWLREEIIKNKAVITSSSPATDLPKEDSQFMEDDNRKGDHSDAKSIDSSGSTEDEDEDEVEAARSAAINQEIKRVLTEVLLKVTDELFDEIATKVLKEDDLSVEVGQDSVLSNHHMLPSTPSFSTPKASAKVLIPTKTKGSDDEDASEKSTSGSPRDILGLGSYASDEEDEIQSSGKPNSTESSMHQHSSSSKLLKGDSVVENGGYKKETEELRNISEKLDASCSGGKDPGNVAHLESNDNMGAKDSKRLSEIGESEFQCSYDTSNLSNSLIDKSVERNEIPDKSFAGKKWPNSDSRIQKDQNTRNGYKNNELENKRSSMKKEHEDSESSKGRLDEKEDEEHTRHAERRARTDRKGYHDNSKDEIKEKIKTGEKAKNTESRKLPSSDDKEGKTEAHTDRRTSSKRDKDEKRKERTGDDRKERHRNKNGSESSRYKRHRSSSVGARDRENNDNTMVSRANDSGDESSDDSKRKSHHSGRRKSPLSTRTRKRQVSRSPSKHSKRRHSPYSSLESTRGKKSSSRSRSRSPVHRRH